MFAGKLVFPTRHSFWHRCTFSKDWFELQEVLEENTLNLNRSLITASYFILLWTRKGWNKIVEVAEILILNVNRKSLAEFLCRRKNIKFSRVMPESYALTRTHTRYFSLSLFLAHTHAHAPLRCIITYAHALSPSHKTHIAFTSLTHSVSFSTHTHSLTHTHTHTLRQLLFPLTGLSFNKSHHYVVAEFLKTFDLRIKVSSSCSNERERNANVLFYMKQTWV